MKKTFYQLLNFLLFSNIFISLGAVAQGLFTYKLLGLTPSPLVCSFLFLATLSTYNLSILVNKPKDFLNSKYKRVRWIFTNYRLNISITIISSLALIPLFFMLNFASQILMVFLGLLSIFYSLPLFSVDNHIFCLRNISGLKLFLIAFVWSFSIVWLPILDANILIAHREIIILVAKQFIFLTAITLPFDIRDLFEDKASNLKTLPTMFGAKKSYLFSLVLLILYVILLLCSNLDHFNSHFWGSIVSVVLAALIIWRSKTSRTEYHYFLFLDGVLIAQYLLLLLFDWIK
jgi:4-hydroxybenzoate polyprenyltransferase